MDSDTLVRMIGEREMSGQLNAVDAIDLAIQRTRYLLFDPVLYSKWLNFGVMIFLGVLAGGGGLTNFVSFFSFFREVNLEAFYFDAEAYVLAHLGAILVVAVPIFSLAVIAGSALMYVGSRGTMMVIRAVAYDDDGIGENWQSVGDASWTYFVFRLELAIATGVYALIAGFVGLVLARQQALGDVPEPEIIVGIVVVTVVSIGVSIAYAFAMFSMRNFVAPLIFHLNVSCSEAWGAYIGIIQRSPGQFLLYMLIKFIYSAVFGVARTFVGCCTCYVGFLPVIGQTLLAPLFVFERAYSLYMIGSLGPEYAIVNEPRPPVPPMLPPTIDAPPPPDINR